MRVRIRMYEKHSVEIIMFSGYDVFAEAEFGSDTDEDIYDEFSIKPELADS